MCSVPNPNAPPPIHAISEYATWNRGRSADTRMDSLWFGDSANILKRALVEGLKMASA